MAREQYNSNKSKEVASTEFTNPLQGVGYTPGETRDEQEAQMWQYMSGGDTGENPYLPYVQPRVVEVDGKKVLRIPKNQTLLDLAKYFDDRQNTIVGQRSDFAGNFLNYLKNNASERYDAGMLDIAYQQLGLNTAKTMYDINKPYYKPGSSGINLNEALSISEANTMGVPVGSTWGDVLGVVPGSLDNTKSYDDFVKELSVNRGNVEGARGQSVAAYGNPQALYSAYKEAQQAIDFNPDLFEQIVSDPEAAPYANLLKPKNVDIWGQVAQSLIDRNNSDQ